MRVFAGRTLTHVKTFTEHAGAVTGVVFGADALWLASSSTDRTGAPPPPPPPPPPSAHQPPQATPAPTS